MGIIGAILALLLGLRIGRRGSGVAICVTTALGVAAAIWARYQWSDTHQASGALMLGGAFALTMFTCSLAFIGPALTQRWQLALGISSALVVALLLTPVEATMCVVLSVCR